MRKKIRNKKQRVLALVLSLWEEAEGLEARGWKQRSVNPGAGKPDDWMSARKVVGDA